MKTKDIVAPKFVNLENIKVKVKSKSLRPMRSMVSVRSLKPKTNVAPLFMKTEELQQTN